jgi:hypothetical protein
MIVFTNSRDSYQVKGIINHVFMIAFTNSRDSYQIKGLDFFVVGDGLHGGGEAEPVTPRFPAEPESRVSIEEEKVFVLSGRVEHGHLRLDGEHEAVAVPGPTALGRSPTAK